MYLVGQIQKMRCDFSATMVHVSTMVRNKASSADSSVILGHAPPLRSPDMFRRFVHLLLVLGLFQQFHKLQSQLGGRLNGLAVREMSILIKGISKNRSTTIHICCVQWFCHIANGARRGLCRCSLDVARNPSHAHLQIQTHHDGLQMQVQARCCGEGSNCRIMDVGYLGVQDGEDTHIVSLAAFGRVWR